jgi:hypothetical protein
MRWPTVADATIPDAPAFEEADGNLIEEVSDRAMGMFALSGLGLAVAGGCLAAGSTRRIVLDASTVENRP